MATGRQVVATGRSNSSGQLVIAVPPGPLIVSVPDAESYEECDAPLVDAVAEQTTPVAQNCSFNAP